MQDLMIVLRSGLALLPIMGGTAILLIAIQTYKVKQMEAQFADCIVRKGIVHAIEIRGPNQTRPYRHRVVTCSFQNSSDLVEIPYDSGDLEHTQAGDELSIYFYPNGTASVLAYDAGTAKAKLKKQVFAILILCAVLSLLIPAVGLMRMNQIR